MVCLRRSNGRKKDPPQVIWLNRGKARLPREGVVVTAGRMGVGRSRARKLHHFFPSLLEENIPGVHLSRCAHLFFHLTEDGGHEVQHHSGCICLGGGGGGRPPAPEPFSCGTGGALAVTAVAGISLLRD